MDRRARHPELRNRPRRPVEPQGDPFRPVERRPPHDPEVRRTSSTPTWSTRKEATAPLACHRGPGAGDRHRLCGRGAGDRGASAGDRRARHGAGLGRAHRAGHRGRGDARGGLLHAGRRPAAAGATDPGAGDGGRPT